MTSAEIDSLNVGDIVYINSPESLSSYLTVVRCNGRSSVGFHVTVQVRHNPVHTYSWFCRRQDLQDWKYTLTNPNPPKTMPSPDANTNALQNELDALPKLKGADDAPLPFNETNTDLEPVERRAAEAVNEMHKALTPEQRDTLVKSLIKNIEAEQAKSAPTE